MSEMASAAFLSSFQTLICDVMRFTIEAPAYHQRDLNVVQMKYVQVLCSYLLLYFEDDKGSLRPYLCLFCSSRLPIH